MPAVPHNDDTETVEAVYVVTIRNSGDERALGANEVAQLLTDAARYFAPDVSVEVESA